MADDLLGFLLREYRAGRLGVDPMTELSLGFLEHLEAYIQAVCSECQDLARNPRAEG